MNCKSGDLVKITGSSDRHLFKIGETVRLKEYLGGMNRAWKAEYLDGHDWWYVCESDMAPVKPATMPQKIIVTTDGKTTLARLFDGKTMVKRAEAKCALSDVFDFGIGAELAVKRLMGEKKPDMGNPVAEPVKESEPVKLYCVKGKAGYLTKGKVYETDKRHFLFDNGFNGPIYDWEAERFDSDDYLKNHLVPLVRRPAKVGEWVYIAKDYSGHHCKPGYIYMVNFKAKNDGVYFKQDGTGYVKQSKYLVLDGYHGDSE